MPKFRPRNRVDTRNRHTSRAGDADLPAAGGRYSTAGMSSDSSEANFNYRPTLPDSPQGGNIAYLAKIKNPVVGHYYWSFSSCANCT